MSVLFTDTTEKRRQERERRIYFEMVQSANSAIIRWKRDGTISFFNEYAQQVFGYSSEGIIGKHVGILLPATESSGTDLTGLVQDIVTYPERYINNINENVCGDGRRIWMTWTNKAICDDTGQVAEILAVGSDVTNLKLVEEALRKSEERYRTLFDTMTEGFACTKSSPTHRGGRAITASST
jgi:PAS domain S-box-containing protein